jgi:hypothetical protein
MTINEKKQNIINSVKDSSDELLIDEVYNLLNAEDALTDVDLDKVPQELQLKLFRAIEDYKEGRYITNDQMKQKIQQWLMK